jgi:hypothetical protein
MVCERWRSFENFLEDMGEAPSGMSLDRYPDNDGDYEPGNCRWATQKDQCNNKRNNLMISYNGKTMTLTQWARHYGMHQTTLYNRYRVGDRPPRLFRIPKG